MAPPPYMPGPSYGPRLRLEAIAEAWQLMTREMAVWVPAAFIAFVLQQGISMVMMAALGPPMGIKWSIIPGSHFEFSVQFLFLHIGALILCNLFVYVLFGGLYHMAVKQVRGERISLADMFLGFQRAHQLIAAFFLVTLLTVAGFFACILPGFVMAGVLMLTVPIIMDRGVGVVQAIEMSFNALKRDWYLAPIFWLALHICSVLGVVACGFGLFFTMPLLFLAPAIVYRDFFLEPRHATYVSPPPYQMGR